MPQHLPQLLRQVRRHRRHHQGQQFQHFLAHLGPHALLQRLRAVNLVVQFHNQRNRRIKVPARIEIVRHPPQRLVRLPQQSPFFLRRRSQIQRPPPVHPPHPSPSPPHNPTNLLPNPP